MNVSMLFYHPQFNVLRLLHPDGKVEFLNLNREALHKEWYKSYFSGWTYDYALEMLSRDHDLIGLV